MLTIVYTPNSGITIGGVLLNWGIKRRDVRTLLGNNHVADDKTFDFSSISQKRDIYENYKSSCNFFFLNYNEHNLLAALDVHCGVEIAIGNIMISFERELSNIVSDLRTISPSFIKPGDGEYFFSDLKLTVSDQETMGNEGSTLGYFYCSVNVDHLVEE